MSASKQRWLVCALLCATTVAVYLQMADHGFIDYDDNVFITENLHLAQGLSREGLQILGSRFTRWATPDRVFLLGS